MEWSKNGRGAKNEGKGHQEGDGMAGWGRVGSGRVKLGRKMKGLGMSRKGDIKTRQAK